MTTPVAPRKAATLLLVRSVAAGLEVFMVERPSVGTFGGLHVFPGGKVDDADSRLGDFCEGMDDDRASAALGVERGGLAFWVAAIRESFEEAGALLCYRGGEVVDLSDPEVEARFAVYRDAVHAGEKTMAELCASERLTLATDRIRYFSHWITPAGAPARFDTRFFITEMPPGQDVVHRQDELEDGLWIQPEEALARAANGRWNLIDPTIVTLESLAAHRTVTDVMAAVRERSHLPEVTPERHRQGMQHPA